MPKDLLTMSKKELTRLEIMKRLEEKRIRQKEAAMLLGVSVRHTRRLLRAYRGQGAEGLLSKRRGKPSNNQMIPEIKKQGIDLLHSRYADFGPTLAQEKLLELHGLKFSVESVRQIMIAQRLWKTRNAKLPTLHQMRVRRACLGELVQIDGSPHAWFEDRGPACTLLVYIDDASGQLQVLYFTPSETTFSYFAATRLYLAHFGRPLAFYSDKNSIFKVNNPTALSGTGMTQFGRAMKELNIEIICAHSPQAKGRVERANQTLQDRLVKELRLQGICSIQAANAFAPTFIADFNQRFAVVPSSSHDAHRPLQHTQTELDLIFSHQVSRTLSKNLTLQHNHVIYQIQTSRPSYALRKAQVTLSEDPQGQISILYKGLALDYSIFHKQAKQAEVVDVKSLNTTLDKIAKPHKPAANHPWRNYGQRLIGELINSSNSQDGSS